MRTLHFFVLISITTLVTLGCDDKALESANARIAELEAKLAAGELRASEIGSANAQAAEMEARASFVERDRDELRAKLEQAVQQAQAAEAGRQSIANAAVLVLRDVSGGVRLREEMRQNSDGNFVRHGKLTRFQRNGSAVMTVEYSDGRPIDQVIRIPHENGKTFIEGQVSRGFMAGEWRIRDDSSKLAIALTYTDGKLTEAMAPQADGTLVRVSIEEVPSEVQMLEMIILSVVPGLGVDS